MAEMMSRWRALSAMVGRLDTIQLNTQLLLAELDPACDEFPARVAIALLRREIRRRGGRLPIDLLH